MRSSFVLASVVAAVSMLVPQAASAFCGFYVAGSGEQLVNDATQVVLMRKGTRTVLSMQNHYKGPPEAFALVVPVPVVLREHDVKTLSPAVLRLVEQMGAPRLVEYWERDPCAPDLEPPSTVVTRSAAPPPHPAPDTAGEKLGVTIEAQFTVGEYQIVILSAKDSTGLDTWLRQQRYNIPAGAEPLLRPYVEGGMKFFVAKVDPAKVRFDGDQAVLSPLRFHYDAVDFTLPIRLGLANSAGTQDLIVNILAPNQRYELANYPNVTIPTNIDVKPAVKDRFAAFYASLFDATLERHPGAVVTEYAWQASTCDPCPGPALDGAAFLTLGADVLQGSRESPVRYSGGDFVLTRLHARYGTELKDDLVFKQAQPIVGGRELRAAGGALEDGATPAPVNNFQGRYAIRYPWRGPIRCNDPVRGRWGPPWRELHAQEGFTHETVRPALDLASAPRGAVTLTAAIAADIPALGVRAGVTGDEPPVPAPPPPAVTEAPGQDTAVKKQTGCGCHSAGGSDVLWAGLLLGWVVRRRRRQDEGDR
jgi:MYXO-CTERM domain-containing protein